METVLQYALGVVIIVVGLALSIGLHEVGHLLPAKLFGVKVTQYMIGFGPTVFSKRRGETEYGIKAIPLGGYISMIGMFPPTKQGGAAHASSTGFLQQLSSEPSLRPQVDDSPGEGAPPRRRRFFNTLVQDAREASAETIGSGEDNRAFYRLPVMKRIVVMLGGPLMNLLLAVLFYAVYLVGFGLPAQTTTLATVSECVVPASSSTQTCEAGATPSPGNAAGLKPGDKLISLGGQNITSWNQATEIIRQSPGAPLQLVYERSGARETTTLTPLLTERYVLDDRGQREENAAGEPVTEEVGFVGISPGSELQRQPVTAVLPQVGENIAAVATMIVNLPQRLIDVANAAFGPDERDINGPLSPVGVGRIAGEVAALDGVSLASKAQALVGLLASLNVALFVFNLVPLMPLDGGHIAAAAWEGIRRRIAKLRGKPDPGPVDAAKLMPLTFTVVIILGAMSALLIYADIVKPVNIFG